MWLNLTGHDSNIKLKIKSDTVPSIHSNDTESKSRQLGQPVILHRQMHRWLRADMNPKKKKRLKKIQQVWVLNMIKRAIFFSYFLTAQVEVPGSQFKNVFSIP